MTKLILTSFAALMLFAPTAGALSLYGYNFVNLSKTTPNDTGAGQWTIVSVFAEFGGPGLNRFGAETACNNFGAMLGASYKPVYIDSVQERDFLSDSVKSHFGEVKAWIGNAVASLGGPQFLTGGLYRVLRIKDKAITTAPELATLVVICERQK